VLIYSPFEIMNHRALISLIFLITMYSSASYRSIPVNLSFRRPSTKLLATSPGEEFTDIKWGPDMKIPDDLNNLGIDDFQKMKAYRWLEIKYPKMPVMTKDALNAELTDEILQLLCVSKKNKEKFIDLIFQTLPVYLKAKK
jgi:hypothetical protein